MTIVVATTNRHKLAEIRQLLDGLPHAIEPMTPPHPDAAPDETGTTFAANARLKALHYAAATPHLTIAEDSGLEIARLDGAPGVHSARFPGATYAEKFDRISVLLRARGATTSPARFVCAVALAQNRRVVFETTGTIEGAIVYPPRGTGGFGYDPIFFYPPYGCTLAEVTAERKTAVSHREHAFRALRKYLQEASP